MVGVGKLPNGLGLDLQCLGLLVDNSAKQCTLSVGHGLEVVERELGTNGSAASPACQGGEDVIDGVVLRGGPATCREADPTTRAHLWQRDGDFIQVQRHAQMYDGVLSQ